MTFNYCPVCGRKTEEKIIGDDGNVPYCAGCEKVLFPFSYPCVLTLIVDECKNFALIQQYNIPAQFYMGVAGYTKEGEIFEDAVKREVLEEVGLVVEKVEYIKSYSLNPNTIMVGFVSEVKHSGFKLSGEVDNAKWFTQEEAQKLLRENSIIQRLFQDYTQNNITTGG